MDIHTKLCSAIKPTGLIQTLLKTIQAGKILLQSSVNFHNLQDPIVLEGGIISVPARVGKRYRAKINGMVVAP